MERAGAAEFFDAAYDAEQQMLDGRESGRAERPVLAVLHQEASSTGYVGLTLNAFGLPVDIRRPCLGEALPETLEKHSGVVIFGGPLSANDNDEHIRRELEWIEVPLREEKPFLGICLGAQLLAKHLGSRVGPDPEGRVEVGYFPLRTHTRLHSELRMPELVFQWHSEGFTLPDGAVLVGEGCGAFANQAFCYGPAACGLQFHPEVTVRMVREWSRRMPEIFDHRGAQAREDLMDAHVQQACEVRFWLRRFVRLWLRGQWAAI